MFTGCTFIDRLRGWAVSEDVIFETNDGAHTWAKVDSFDAQGRPAERTHQDGIGFFGQSVKIDISLTTGFLV